MSTNIKLINASGQSTVYENIDTLKMTDEDNHYVFFGISYTQYNVSYNLATESHSSSSDTTVNSNGTYTTTISYDSGYTKDSIVVTMGGTDISSTAVSGNVITVENPTGDISITVTTKVQTGYSVTINDYAPGDGYAKYSLDDGTTWLNITKSGILVSGITQIKFLVGAPGRTETTVSSSQLSLSIHAGQGNEQTSTNFTLEENITDICVTGGSN